MTRPESILFGMTVAFLGMLMSAVILLAVVIMALRLSSLRRTATDGGDVQAQRRRIVVPSLVIIGVAIPLWVILLALNIWWNIIRGSALERMFVPRQLWF